jgi:hypothetical protein
MTLATAYLVVGDTPDITGEVIGGDKRTEFKQQLGAKITDMRNEAQRLGITIVPLRRFVELIGYKMPKGSGVAKSFGYESRVPGNVDLKKDEDK